MAAAKNTEENETNAVEKEKRSGKETVRDTRSGKGGGGGRERKG